jgi:tetratricopeptide (TPR) repeat protein
VPDHASAFHDRALIYAQQKKYQEALDDLSRAQFLVPNSPLPYFNRGRVYETMGKRAEAINEYKKARARAPRMKEPQEALRRLGVR